MRPKIPIGVVTCLVGVVALSVTASADQERVRDPRDVTGPLDIAWIDHAHKTDDKGRERFVHTVHLYKRWPVQKLRHRGFINLFFDLKGHRNAPDERAIYLTYEDGRLQAELVSFSTDPPTVKGLLPMWRPDGRTVKVSVPRSALRRSNYSFYRWRALSFIEEGHPSCGESGGCSDGAPDSRYLCHDL